MSQWIVLLLQLAASPEGQKIIKVIVDAILEAISNMSAQKASEVGHKVGILLAEAKKVA